MENSILSDIKELEGKIKEKISQMKGPDEEESKEEALIKKRLS